LHAGGGILDSTLEQSIPTGRKRAKKNLGCAAEGGGGGGNVTNVPFLC